MHIVVLDSYTLNPGDLDWTALEALGSVTLYDRTAPGDVLARSQGADALLTNKVVLSGETIARLPDLKYIGVMATGYNVVDVEAAKARGIPVTNAAGYSTFSTAQHTMALLLELSNRVGQHQASVQQGDWVRCPDFTYQLGPLVELAGKTLGIVGFGRIGQAVAQMAQGFGMQILSYHTHPERDARPGVEFVSLDEVFRRSDVVTLHCPLTADNQGMVNRERLSTMKRSAWLINTGRGPLVHEADLREALEAGTIAGAALDVLSSEPPAADNPLLGAKNCLVTPHIAWASYEARSRLLATVVDNLRAFQAGTWQNVVNGLTGKNG
ncbi:glycerate dehydrogenase [Catalinimonas alkaloidigena]|uniref:Glycerate dehydrogenase n=1 Tax=Catalinimonas alkaloidigena TaxID=1075417 RepID=A0A1G9GYJ5_9BACT|nr:D-2-hydroxyacid dehydrogenase [Catalinimonas alkaloidigena]SDL05780.1 glycerate dehydrogenase [Catalinimonas alkaloidigena]